MSADRASAGFGVKGASQGSGGAGEVVGHGRAGQPGGVRGEPPGRQVSQSGVFEVGDDLLDGVVPATVSFDEIVAAVGEEA